MQHITSTYSCEFGGEIVPPSSKQGTSADLRYHHNCFHVHLYFLIKDKKMH